MILHHPFFIGSALSAALKVGDDATLTLLETELGERDTATFELMTPEFVYVDDRMQSGMQGFESTVEAFATFLNFLEAAVESFDYGRRTGRDGENMTLFPRYVVEWAYENRGAIEEARACIEDENGDPLTSLIEE